MAHVGSGRLQNIADVGQALLCLLFNRCSCKLAGCRVNRNLTGDVDGMSVSNCLGIWADGGRSVICVNAFYTHVLFLLSLYCMRKIPHIRHAAGNRRGSQGSL